MATASPGCAGRGGGVPGMGTGKTHLLIGSCCPVPRENACPSKRQNVVLMRDVREQIICMCVSAVPYLLRVLCAFPVLFRHVVKVCIHPGVVATKVSYLGVKRVKSAKVLRVRVRARVRVRVRVRS